MKMIDRKGLAGLASEVLFALIVLSIGMSLAWIGWVIIV